MQIVEPTARSTSTKAAFGKTQGCFEQPKVTAGIIVNALGNLHFSLCVHLLH